MCGMIFYMTFTFAFNHLRKRQKGAPDMDYEIRWVYGHVEVYDNAGTFRFSADSEREALEELRELAA